MGAAGRDLFRMNDSLFDRPEKKAKGPVGNPGRNAPAGT